MISVQAAGCAPIVDALRNGDERARKWENASTEAHGLRRLIDTGWVTHRERVVIFNNGAGLKYLS
ncbi:MAG: hypothetical protein E3J37_01950 [Anaerolineales bacterium]|nr:MAG: hypothetical protein E3J37_01950 [Anaerolineales bacterium]